MKSALFRSIGWSALVIVCLAFSTSEVGAKDGPFLINVCPQFGFPTTGTWYQYSDPRDVEMDANTIQSALHVYAGRDIWVGYENGGFSWDSSVQPALTMTLYMADGDERWIEIYQPPDQPESYYLLAYANTDWYADANGEHPGYHPCKAIQMTRNEYEQLVASLLQPTQSVTVAK